METTQWSWLFHRLLRRLFRLLAIVVWIAQVMPVHYAAADTPPVPVTFKYAFLSPLVEEPSQISDISGWQELNPKLQSLKPVKGKVLWLRIALPPTAAWTDPVISFERLQVSFKYFHGQRLVQRFGDGVSYPGMPVHYLSVPVSQSESVAWLRVQSTLPRIGPRGEVFLGSRSDFMTGLIRGDMADIFVVCTLLLISVSGFALFAFYRNVRTYLNLASFSLASCLYFIGRMPSKTLFEIDPVASGYVGLCGLYASPFFFLAFFREIFSVSHVLILRVTQHVSMCFWLFSIVFSIFASFGPLQLLLPFYVVAIASFTTALIFTLKRLRKHPYSKIFLAGVSLLFASGLWEVGREIRIFNANLPMITWGFLGFVMSLVTMQGQFFSSLFVRVKQNAQLAEEARERLERVLACTHELSRTREYASLIHVVADAIVAELKLLDEQVSIDFFMTDDKNQNSDSAMRQFRYMTYGSGSKSELSELKDAAADSAERTDAPQSVLTLPLLSSSFVGAVTIRKFSDCPFGLADLSHLNKFVGALSASLLIALQNLDYVSEVKARTQMENQLDAAHSLQEALMPEPLRLNGVHYSSYCKSAGKTGGDWHGHYHCKVRNRLFVTVGDVTGHDFASSIMTGVAAGAVKAWEQNDAHRFEDCKEALEELASLVNKVLCESNRGLKFMSMIFLCFDLQNSVLYFVNAGHPHPYHLDASGHSNPLVSSGHILGQNAMAQFQVEEISLSRGDSILIYTDGLFENHGKNGECLSRRSLLKSLSTLDNSDGLLDCVLSKAQKVWGDEPAEDDVTLVAVTLQPQVADLSGAA